MSGPGEDPTFYYHWLGHKSCLHCGSQNVGRAKYPRGWHQCADCSRTFDPMVPPAHMVGDKVIFYGYPSDRGQPWKYQTPYRPGMTGEVEDRSQNPSNGLWQYQVRFRDIATRPQGSMFENWDPESGVLNLPPEPEEDGQLHDHVNWFGGNQIEPAEPESDTFPESWPFEAKVASEEDYPPSYWHVAPRAKRDTIRAQGLRAQEPRWDDAPGQPKGTYLFRDQDHAHYWGWENFAQAGVPVDLWEVTPPREWPLHEDARMGVYPSVYSPQDIPAEYLYRTQNSDEDDEDWEEWHGHQAKVANVDLQSLPLHPLLGEGLAETLANPIRFDYRYRESKPDWGGIDRHYYDVDPVGAPARYDFTDEWGKTKAYGYDPELVDIAPGRFGAEFNWKDHPEWQRDAYREPEAEGWGLRKPFEEQNPANPDWLYRGLSHEEWEQAKQRGYFQSTGTHNIAGEKGTLFSTEPGQAQSYAAGFAPWFRKPTFNAPSYVVAVPRPADAYPNGHLGEDTSEIIVPGQVPFDQVQQAWQFRPYAMQHGDMLVRSEDYKTYFGQPNTQGYYAWRPVPLGREVTSSGPRHCPHCQGSGWVSAPLGLMDIPSLDLGTGQESPMSWEPPGRRDPCPNCYGTGVLGLGRDQPDPMMPSDAHMNEWGAISQDYNIDPLKLPPVGSPRQGSAKTASPLYYRWVFSPQTGRVELASNSEGHPLDVRYHSDLARELNEPNLTHGYAVRFGGGWRIRDWNDDPIEDQYTIASVMRALNGQEASRTASEALWSPVLDGWDRCHHGLPT